MEAGKLEVNIHMSCPIRPLTTVTWYIITPGGRVITHNLFLFHKTLNAAKESRQATTGSQKRRKCSWWTLLDPVVEVRRVLLVPMRAVDGGAAWWLLEHAAGVLAVVALHVHGVSLLVLVEELLLEVPVVWLGADGEFEIFFGDGVPVLCRWC